MTELTAGGVPPPWLPRMTILRRTFDLEGALEPSAAVDLVSGATPKAMATGNRSADVIANFFGTHVTSPRGRRGPRNLITARPSLSAN